MYDCTEIHQSVRQMRDIMSFRKTFFAATVVTVVIAMLLIAVPDVAADHVAGEEPSDYANISWIAVCSILVFIMTPGVALFYGGMLRKQSMTSVIAQTLLAMAVMGISWFAVGYSLAFSEGNVLIGGFDFVFFNNVSADIIADGAYIPDMEFAMFQMMFALITAGIVLGACAERIRYTAITWFLVIWSILVYAPMAHMVWGGGLLMNLPFGLETLDFAGGTVVHICAGTTGLALAAYLGKRNIRTIKRAHSIPMVFFGGFLFWFGWFGFNGGSGLAANGQAINAMVVSMVAAVCAMAAWAVVQYLHVGRVGVLGLAAGSIAGLVAITPGAGYVSPISAVVIGLVGGVVCYFGTIFMRNKSGIDDALDVMGVHGIGGIWGAIATGLFAEFNISGAGGILTTGDWQLFVGNIVAVIITMVFCFVVSYVIIWVIGKLMRVRATESEELIGQDLVEHGEPAYVM